MVDTKGKGKASTAKSKRRTPSMVSAVPEPIVAEKSSQGPSNGQNKIEIPSIEEKESNYKKEIPCTDEKENDGTTSGLVIGNGFEENQPLPDEGNDDEKSNVKKNEYENSDNEKNGDEKDAINELNTNEVSLSGQTKEKPEEVNGGDGLTKAVDSQINGVDTKEENIEELRDGGGAVNNISVEDNEGKPDDEVAVENKEPTNDRGGEQNIRTGEEIEDTRMAEEGKMVTGEGLASKHGVIDEEMMSKGASYKLNAEKPLSTSADDEEMAAEERENVSIANNVEASANEAKKPKRKIIRKKLIKKVRKKDATSNNEAKPQSSIVNDSSSNANSAQVNEHERNGEKAERKPPVKVNKKQNRKRKSVVSESNASDAVFSDGLKAEPTNSKQGTEVLKETDKVEVEVNKKAKKSRRKASRLKKKRKQKLSNDETTSNVNTGDTDKPGPSREGKSKKADTKGMIFTCSSETKKDCYHYKVLGLPAGKKDFVSKIYKGMKLFLFDVELKMLYGIYKAAAPGGFNIEPGAFKSKFPSQVRFTVLKECVPLAEEKFKRVIKLNYFTKNKFNFNLTRVQVGKLCKLFHETSRKADSTQIVRNPVEAAPSSAQRDKKRKRKTREGRKVGPTSSSKWSRRRKNAEKEVRRGPAVVDDRYYQHPVVSGFTSSYLPPPAPPVQVVYQSLPPPIPPRPSAYSYGRPTRDDIYWREPLLERVPVIEHRELSLSSLRLPSEANRCEPYGSYRETRTSYLEPAYETGIRRDLYEPSARRDLYEPSVRRDLYEPSVRRELYDYTLDARRIEYYNAAEYRAPLPPYRRY